MPTLQQRELLVFGGRSSLYTDLVAYWKLEESSGNRVDATGRGNDLSPLNSPTNATGIIGSAVQTTTTGSKSLQRASTSDLTVGNIDFTVSLWVYADALSGNPFILSKENDSSTREYRIDWSGSRFRWVTFNAAGSAILVLSANNLGAPSTATWYHIVAWHDAAADTMGIQVNGGTADTGSTSGTAPASNASAFNVGASWNGRVDELGFWRRVLTASERLALYNSGAGRSYPF